MVFAEVLMLHAGGHWASCSGFLQLLWSIVSQLWYYELLIMLHIMLWIIERDQPRCPAWLLWLHCVTSVDNPVNYDCTRPVFGIGQIVTAFYNYKYLDTVTDVNNKICLSQWVCSALVSVPRPVTRWNSSTVIGHQPCCWPQSGLAPGEKTSGWRGMDRSCLVSLTSLSSPGTFHLSPLTATAPPSQSAVNNSDGCSKAGLKLSKLVWISSKLGPVHQLQPTFIVAIINQN